jgi:hypothetical protein
MKTCKTCGIEKPLEEFQRNKVCKDGHVGQCKSCLSEQRKEAYREQTPEQRATREAKVKTYRKRYLEKKLAEAGELPLCACGCGERVTIRQDNGKVRKYAHLYTPFSDPDFLHWVGSYPRDTIDKATFRAALVRVKDQKGWTWRELEHRAGLKPGHIDSVIYDKRRIGVGRDWARDLFRRLAGESLPPTPYQLRMNRESRADVVITKMGVDPDKPQMYTDAWGVARGVKI